MVQVPLEERMREPAGRIDSEAGRESLFQVPKEICHNRGYLRYRPSDLTILKFLNLSDRNLLTREWSASVQHRYHTKASRSEIGFAWGTLGARAQEIHLRPNSPNNQP